VHVGSDAAVRIRIPAVLPGFSALNPTWAGSRPSPIAEGFCRILAVSSRGSRTRRAATRPRPVPTTSDPYARRQRNEINPTCDCSNARGARRIGYSPTAPAIPSLFQIAACPRSASALRGFGGDRRGVDASWSARATRSFALGRTSAPSSRMFARCPAEVMTPFCWRRPKKGATDPAPSTMLVPTLRPLRSQWLSSTGNTIFC